MGQHRPHTERKRDALKRRRLFVHHFLAGPKGVRGDPTKAAILAGFAERSINQTVYELKRDPEVQALMKAQLERFDLSDERILAEYCAIAFANISDVLKVDPATGEIEVENIDTLPPTITAAIAEIKPIVDPATGRTRYSIKMHDKKGALDFLAKVRGLIRTPDVQVVLLQLMANLDLSVYTTEELKLMRTLMDRGLTPQPPTLAPVPESRLLAGTAPRPEPPPADRNGHGP